MNILDGPLRTLAQVELFHRTFNAYVGEEPSVPPAGPPALADLGEFATSLATMATDLHTAAGKRAEEGDANGALLLIRLQLLVEEVGEFAMGLAKEDLLECLDGLTDTQYVLDGAYLALGLQDVKTVAFDEVQRSNMSKLGPDGQPMLSAGGRVIKGPNYSPPNLEQFINKE